MRERTEAAAQELAKGRLRIEPGKASLISTCNEVRRAWLAVGDILIREQQPALAAHVRGLIAEMHPPQTEKEIIAREIMRRDGREPLVPPRSISSPIHFPNYCRRWNTGCCDAGPRTHRSGLVRTKYPTSFVPVLTAQATS